jgi:hypothetical protein
MSTVPSSAVTWRQNSRRPNTSRATSQVRVMSGTEAPVSSFRRKMNVVPEVSTISFTTEVVMISWRSGCEPIGAPWAARSGTGK